MLNRIMPSFTMRIGVLCDHALVGQDGKLSIIGIFDHINVVQLPAQHPRFFVVAVLQGESESNHVDMELVAPDGRTLMRETITIDPEAVAQGSGNLIAEVTLLPLEMAGQYEFRLHGEQDLIGAIPLIVNGAQAAPPPPLHIVPRT